MKDTVTIGGKEYKPVALRVKDFRATHPIENGWCIRTEIITLDEERVVMCATISHEGAVVAMGYAEEVRKSSKVNRTSALENCETSAIGRALAACGFVGTEYASATEAENAVADQEELIADCKTKAIDALERGDWLTLCQLDSAGDDVWVAAWKKIGSKQRSAIKELQTIRDRYRDGLNATAQAEDRSGFSELSSELQIEEARYLHPLINDIAKQWLIEEATARKQKDAA